MKKNLFLLIRLFIVALLLSPVSLIASDNLILSGDMESQGSWSVSYLNTEDGSLPNVEWGYTGDKPAASAGKVLRISADNPAGLSQYCIYQKVTLTAGETYELDGAFKGVNSDEWDNTWVEAFIGVNPPIDGDDYGDGNGEQIMNFSVWVHPTQWDGTFMENAHGSKTFTAEISGDYYLVLKAGCNGGGKFELLLDDLSLVRYTLPVASFTATSPRAGFAPLNVSFTSTSLRATSYEWSFGDGQTSTSANPTHTYNNEGTYTVTLKVKNANGENIEEKTDYVKVSKLTTITGGGKLQGGNMEDASKWSISTLNSPSDQTPTATWNYTGNTPSAGQGGALRIQATGSNDVTTQYCIYQRVTLDASKVYRFNAAFRDLSDDLYHFFSEVFISELEPEDGEDFGEGDGTLLVALSNWEDESSIVRKLDGSYQLHGDGNEFIPEYSGDYYFVYKAGVYAGEGQTLSFDIVVDELLLEEVRTKPYTNFTADSYLGFAPLEVAFQNTTLFADAYEWNFGDGQTSTETNPTHTYSEVGQYTVTLKATNEVGDSTMVKTDFVVVNVRPDLPEGEKLYGGDMENAGYWYTAELGADVVVSLEWNYRDDIPTGGEGGALRLYVESISGQGSNIALYQPVEVKKGYEYNFDALFKDLGDTDQMWAQVFIVNERPTDDRESDLIDEKLSLGQLNTWSDASVKGFDGPFSEKAIIGETHENQGGFLLNYHHTGEDAVYYFVLKIGTWDHTMNIVLDNLSLKESVYTPKPRAAFSADQTYGAEAPFTVQFFSESENAETFFWQFGDGGTSTEEDPEHTYEAIGAYTVSLTVTSGDLSHTATINNMIRVGVTGIENSVVNNCIIYVADKSIHVTAENPWSAIALYDINGKLIEYNNGLANEYKKEGLTPGFYVLMIDGKPYKVVVR